MLGVRGDDAAVGEHDLGREDVVDREPVPATEEPDAAAEGDACDTDGPGVPEPGRQPVLGRRAAVGAGGGTAAGVTDERVRVDRDGVEAPHVEDETAGAGAVVGVAVAAAADGHGEARGAGSADGGDDVRRRAHLCDGGGRVVEGGELPGGELGEALGIGSVEPAGEGLFQVGESCHRRPHFPESVRGPRG